MSIGNKYRNNFNSIETESVAELMLGGQIEMFTCQQKQHQIYIYQKHNDRDWSASTLTTHTLAGVQLSV